MTPSAEAFVESLEAFARAHAITAEMSSEIAPDGAIEWNVLLRRSDGRRIMLRELRLGSANPARALVFLADPASPDLALAASLFLGRVELAELRNLVGPFD